ncbi:10433_t:CDS:2, partial [Racocetra persica]
PKRTIHLMKANQRDVGVLVARRTGVWQSTIQPTGRRRTGCVVETSLFKDPEENSFSGLSISERTSEEVNNFGGPIDKECYNDIQDEIQDEIQDLEVY